MNKALLLFMTVFLFMGCARVKVEAPKDPIKVDVSMRLDIYQHVVKDIDNIENIVTGGDKEVSVKDKNSLLMFFINNAYADDGFGAEVEKAALRRKDRRSMLEKWQSSGVIGENRLGLLEVKVPSGSNAQIQDLVNSENEDRIIIYKSVARKNGVGIQDVQELYAKRLQQDAPAGTPIEVVSAGSGDFEWVRK